MDIFDGANVAGNDRLTLNNGGGPMFVLHEGEQVKVQAGSAGDMEFAVTFDLIDVPVGFVGFV